ncbi:MAG: NAD(P)H-binding protein [Myxococcales bacterium]|nr:NAD(P)H-binding protein [Myxococcales bacterium]
MTLNHKSPEYLNDALRSGGLIFVAGATGFVGRALVAELAARGRYVIAHIRPDSGHLDVWQTRLASLGERVAIDTTPWELAAMAAAMRRYRPRAVCFTIGTTRKAAGRAGIGGNIYQAVDVALCRLLAKATATAQAASRFVLLSSVGAGESRNAYLQARADMERAVREAGLPCTVFRPSVITGDRDEFRFGEAAAARVGDALLGAVGVFAPGVRARYRSISPAVLARQLADATDDTAPWRVVEAQALARG